MRLRSPGRGGARHAMLVAVVAVVGLFFGDVTVLSAQVRSEILRGGAAERPWRLDTTGEDSILALDPENLSPADIAGPLSMAPAPRIIALQGSIALVSMRPFAEFLMAMGYPERSLRDPASGSLSRGSFGDSAELAGNLAWYYESEAMMPMLIGHSQGGMLAIKVLYELAGTFAPAIHVWNPAQDHAETRTTIVDPLTGVERPVVGLVVPYVAALATGKFPRFVLGQWSMLSRLRQIPDTVDEFTGFTLDWDPIAGTYPGSEPYRAMGTANVRNITLPAGAHHVTLPLTTRLAADPAARAWIERYRPWLLKSRLPRDEEGDMANIVHAADIWYSVSKHWCIEVQRLIRAHRQMVAGQNDKVGNADGHRDRARKGQVEGARS